MKLENISFIDEIRSDRVILRRLSSKDNVVIYDIYSHKESALLDDWVPFESIVEADKMIAQAEVDFSNKSELKYGIVDRKSNELVGCCGLFGFDEWNQKCTLFYQVHHDERNKGYASEGVKLLIDYAFAELKANRVEAYITPGNDSSIRVLEKNGLINEGTLREMEFYKNKFWDGIVMAILRRDYEESTLKQ